jgi:uncharacterized membrane protein (DUF106 family)
MTDVRAFVEEHEWAPAVLAAVLARAEAGDGTVRWADVRGEVDSTHWGTLVERELVVDAGGAFVVDDPVAVREVLADIDGTDVPEPAAATEADPDAAVDGPAADGGPAGGGDAEPDADDGSGGWSTADRAAGVGALVLMTGYQVAGIRNAVGGTLDVVLGPAEAMVPFPALVLLLAVGSAVATTLVRRRLGGDDAGTERVDEIREEVAAARERGDEERVQELAEEQKQLVVSTFSGQLRPMAWTMVLTVPLFLWLYWVTLSPTQAVAPVVTVLPYLGDVVWTAKVVGPMRAWMLWYLACSLSSGAAVRRAVGRVAGE